ncbi:unnamed protein product [Lepeophtheirus salmonis]|uniref:(salmon louse) hypothetical protein n=1 Tax=Lepeophtheirus salmonis TaxID=72036 RepID=A0A7R8HED1_LEPSM|nr:unnamed protein product [Lepeophtheirus salmonis]CAF3042383.1 unnamed protein product [Lepeophtheirus salmonis]
MVDKAQLCNHCHDAQIVRSIAICRGKESLSDLPPRSPTHRFNMLSSKVSSVYVANVDKQSPESRSTTFLHTPEAGVESIFTTKKFLLREYSDVTSIKSRYHHLYHHLGTLQTPPYHHGLFVFLCTLKKKTEIKFAGFRVTIQGIQAYPEKIKSNRSISNTLEHLRSPFLLRIGGTLRKIFRHGLSKIHDPKLTPQSQNPYIWIEDHLRAFEEVKKRTLPLTCGQPIEGDDDFTQDMYGSISIMRATPLYTLNNSDISQITCDPITLDGIARYPILEEIAQTSQNDAISRLIKDNNLEQNGKQNINPKRLLEIEEKHHFDMAHYPIPNRLQKTNAIKTPYSQPITGLGLAGTPQRTLQTHCKTALETTMTRQKISSNPSLLAPRSR